MKKDEAEYIAKHFPEKLGSGEIPVAERDGDYGVVLRQGDRRMTIWTTERFSEFCTLFVDMVQEMPLSYGATVDARRRTWMHREAQMSERFAAFKALDGVELEG